MKTDAIVLSASQPDATLLKRVVVVQTVCLAIAALISIVILFAWFVTDVHALYPDGWYLMKFDTAASVLLSAIGLTLLSQDASPLHVWGGRAAAWLVLLLAVVALYEHISGRSSGFDTLFVADTTSNKPGLMSMQTAVYFLLMALSLQLATMRGDRAALAVVVLAKLLTLHALIIFSGYCFNAVQLFGQSMSTRTSPHTLACMMLLATALIGWRMQLGYFPVLVGTGLGSRIARQVLPITLLLPFVLMLSSTAMARAGWLSPPVAVGLTIAILAAVLGALVSLMGQRINTLEHDLRELSLHDELTGVLNYRGFELLGGQSFLEAQRSHASVTLLAFSVESVRELIESAGHDAGSHVMQDMARVLKSSFEPADIIARTESDEFAVITQDENAGGVIALMRIGEALETLNAADRPYKIRFSVGEAISDPDSGESFHQLIDRAGLMQRERRRVERAAGSEGEENSARSPSGTTRSL